MTYIQFTNLLKYKQIQHFIAADNMSLLTPDGVGNRQLYADAFHFALQNAVSANQSHGCNVHRVLLSDAGRGAVDAQSRIDNCDALITNELDVPLFIMTADCVPLLLYDAENQAVAAVHAGWKGTALRIACRAVERMTAEFGSKPENIVAGIGPAIGECCYEVGDEVVEAVGSEFVTNITSSGKSMLNLPLANSAQLVSCGLKNENIEFSGICTCCNAAWPSWRREQTQRRLASVIWLKS